MLKNILPNELTLYLNKLNLSLLTEIRLRSNKPILVFMGAVPYFLSENGISNMQEVAIECKKEWVEDIIFRASNCSMYSVNENIKRGFLVLDNGVRIGICGDAIVENGNIKTITNFSSISIRVPHQVKNCSRAALSFIYENEEVKNTLIVSSPGAGKTTFIRDLCYQLSQENCMKNISIIDERGEIASSNLSTGNYTDIISFLPKKLAFEQMIRVMTPDIIVADELSIDDVPFLINAFNSGVKIFATLHAKNIEELKSKKGFQTIFENKFFDRFIILTKEDKPGVIEGIYNSKFMRIGLV